MPMIEFTVFGCPIPAGSKRAYPIKRKDGSIGVAVTPDNKKQASWMGAVADAARRVYDGPLLTGAVSLEITFFRPRPKGHFGTGKNAAVLKPSAPKYPTTRPDTVKLARAVEDALTSVIWLDDSQVVNHVLSKRYGKCASTEICIGTPE